MKGTTESREQLHKWMDERRGQLRITWADIARHMDMTEENLLRIRKGRIGISLKAAKKLELALKWAPGSIEAAVERGERPNMPNAEEQWPAIDVETGTLSDWQRGLMYFHHLFRDSPVNYERLLTLMDLHTKLQRRNESTQGGVQLDA